ncbi:MAG TPA: response regulator [Gemmatimonadaceae bacterium]|nr:response regulator [Gemmatimonadaceae bacterium]
MLIADDDQVFATTLGDILRLRGYEPVPVASGREAVESASMHPPVAIVDLHLPDMSGMDVVSALHTVSETTSVIVLTGNGTLETAIAALREESFDYLLKPVDVDVLLNVVSVGVERWRMRTFQAQLRQSEARYRELFDRNPQPLWVFDLETLRFVALNDSATRQYGYSREELLSMTVEQIRPVEDIAAFRQDVFAPAREEGKRWRHRRKDGTIIDVEVIANDFMFAGRPSRLALIIDVTSRLRQERAQRARAQQQAAVAEFGQDALALRDVDGLMQRASDVVARTLEVPLVALFERHPGRQQLQMRAGSGWDAALATFLMDDVTSLDAPVLAEHGVVSGHTVEIPGPASPLGVLGAYDRVAREFSSNDTHFLQAMAHIVGGAVSRIASERALRQSQRLEAVGRVAGGVAHDFNNIVTAITGFTELVKAELRPGDAALDDVQEILNATQRARALSASCLPSAGSRCCSHGFWTSTRSYSTWRRCCGISSDRGST